MPIIVKKRPIIKPPATVAVDPELSLDGFTTGCPGEEYVREERLAIMTIEGGLSEEEAIRYIDHPELIPDYANNGKIKPWNPESEVPYLEFWYRGQMIGGAHVPPENDEEVTERFFKRYEKPYAKIKERMSEERKRSLFRGHIKTW